MKQPATLDAIFTLLSEAYGKQGWWPVFSRRNTAGFDARGYHPNNPIVPDNPQDRWEIAVGAILTQNTAWTNVEKALLNLHEQSLMNPHAIAQASLETLSRAIRPSGYFNQKARRLKIFAQFFLDLGDGIPSRNDLIALHGIGPETADSLLLYGWRLPYFVVDAYTIRVLRRIGLADDGFTLKNPSKRYEHVQYFILSRIQSRPSAETFNEYHALLVRHAKEHCGASPHCTACPLEPCCKKMI